MTNVNPIDTEYNGYKFRSRLEARWAIFFDQMGVRYQYEPEGFDLDGIKYLPDFQLSTGMQIVGRQSRGARSGLKLNRLASLKRQIGKKLPPLCGIQIIR